MSDTEHLFMCLLPSHLYVFLGESLFSSLAHFLIGSFIFLELSWRSCLYIFEINPLSVASFILYLKDSPQNGKKIKYLFLKIERLNDECFFLNFTKPQFFICIMAIISNSFKFKKQFYSCYYGLNNLPTKFIFSSLHPQNLRM